MKIKHFLLLILVLVLHFPLQGQTHSPFIRGRITDLKTNSPICFADISTRNNKFGTKSNTRGEFLLFPNEFPTTLRISKFGFKEATVIINNPDDSVLISLTPLEVHKSYSGNKKLLQYELIFKKALEKLRVDYYSGSTNHSQRGLVYSRISSSVDSTVNSLFDSYAQMNVCGSGLLDYQPVISRYAVSDDHIPGLSGNRLDFKIDPYVNLPIMAERLISQKGYIIQDSNQIAMVRVDLDKTISTYYINVADTSILYIKSTFRSGKKERITGSEPAWQSDRVISAEISFSYHVGNTEDFFIDWASTNEEFKMIRKNTHGQNVSKSQLFAVVPDSSMICNSIRDEVAHEALTEMKRQINFRAKYIISGNSTAFDSETDKLLLKPYRSAFWAQNTCVMPDKNERKQITHWENDNMFYSEDRFPTAKETISTDSLVGLMNHNLVPIENVYVETDRPDYLSGDTIWFSAFVLDNQQMDSTSLSKILYVDLINSDNSLEKHLKLIISSGRTHGDFELKKDAKNGIYRLRAYTQYIRNFQSDYLFEKDIQVHQSDFTNMISVNPVIRKSSEGDSVELHIKTVLPDEYQVSDKKLEVLARLNDTLSFRKTFTFKKVLNESMGFFVPSSLSCPFTDVRLILSGQTVISEQRLSIPLRSGINLQFFPESGKMVDGINNIIAFKATDGRGYPSEFKADISDENNNMIKHISGGVSGIGKFEFTPEYNHTYRALVNLQGSKYYFKLPGVEPKGYVLNFNVDSSDILIRNNDEDLIGSHYLLLSVRGAVYAAIETKLDFRPLKVHLPLKMYPKGIIQVTLYDSLFRPLAERLVFNNRTDRKMTIKVETDKNLYQPGEEVILTLNVTDVFGNPVRSSLSLAVMDASKSDSTMSCPDIESYLYLTSELKGSIDYRLLNLSDTTSAGNRKRDLVMMTQGWRNFLWNSIRYKNTYKVLYPIEKKFRISGSVYNLSNTGSCSGYKLNYIDFKSGFNGITEVDANNKFNIEIPYHYNSHDYFIQNKNDKDRVRNLGFVLDTFPFPEIPYRKNELPFRPYKAGYLKAIDYKFSEIDSVRRLDIKYIKIPEVIIKAKADHTGYSAPDKTIDLEKKDPTGKKYGSLFQLIYQEFGEKAFLATGYEARGQTYNPILVVNGAPMTATECPPCYDFAAYAWAATIPVKEVSDVKFYEAGSKYSQWLTPSPAPPTMGNVKWKTDVLGNGLYMLPWDRKIYLPVVSLKTNSKSYRGNPRGAIIFPYQGIYMAREFYQPDYENKNIGTHDNRTTIYWEPEIETDSTGTATVSFYNSNLEGEAFIRISGVSFSLKDASTAVSHYLSH
jgi:CarboxypepD_reg-like domain